MVLKNTDIFYCGCSIMQKQKFSVTNFLNLTTGLGVCVYIALTLVLSSPIAFTNAVDSQVHERTVSVRPSRNMRVMDDS